MLHSNIFDFDYMIPQFSQKDARWGQNKLGASNVNIYSFGCTLTCLAMLFHNYGIELDPGELEKKLSEYKAINNEGLIIWHNITKAFPAVRTFSRDYVVQPPWLSKVQLTTGEAVLEKIHASIRIGQFPLVNVPTAGLQTGHWVLAVESLNKENFFIHDPAYGDRLLFSERYGDPTQQIFGLARLVGPAQKAPDETMRSLAFKAMEMYYANLPEEQYKIDTYSKELLKTVMK